jgi:hypothetical protein
MRRTDDPYDLPKIVLVALERYVMAYAAYVAEKDSAVGSTEAATRELYMALVRALVPGDR